MKRFCNAKMFKRTWIDCGWLCVLGLIHDSFVNLFKNSRPCAIISNKSDTWKRQCGIHRAYSYNSTTALRPLSWPCTSPKSFYCIDSVWYFGVHEGRFACKLRGGDVVTSAHDSDRFHRSFLLCFCADR